MIATPLAALRDGWFADAQPVELRPLGEGHINDTFLVTRPPTDPAGNPQRFVLQALSRRVFADPLRVMDNVCRVLEHFVDAVPRLPALVKTVQDRSAWVDGADDCWRLWRFREHSRVLRRPVGIDEARSAGYAFGAFQRQMQSLPEPKLAPTIVGFLDLGHYLREYDQILTRTGLEVPKAEHGFIELRRPLAGRFPPRGDYIHGDCKLDNLLFAEQSDQVDCVLDLDTVMPGHWAWDFGDLVRSIATTEGELRSDLVLAAARGFVSGSGRVGEVAALVDAPGYIGLMLAVRFFSDHLAGNQYFKVDAPGDNLQRAREQIALVESFEQHRHSLFEMLSADPLFDPGLNPELNSGNH